MPVRDEPGVLGERPPGVWREEAGRPGRPRLGVPSDTAPREPLTGRARAPALRDPVPPVGAPDRDSPVRGCAPLVRPRDVSVRVREVPARPDDPPERPGDAPERPGAPLERDVDAEPPLRCCGLPERRAEPSPERGPARPADWFGRAGRARRSGRGDCWGIGRFYVYRTCVPTPRRSEHPSGRLPRGRRLTHRARALTSGPRTTKTPSSRSSRGSRHEKSRRRPTLPGGLPPSTIGAGGLNCRVRNGNGCFPAAMATGNRALGGPAALLGVTWRRLAASSQPLSVPKRTRAWLISKPSAD